jgi:hypothetical protein
MTNEKKTFAEWMRGLVHVHKPDAWSSCSECAKLWAIASRSFTLKQIRKTW